MEWIGSRDNNTSDSLFVCSILYVNVGQAMKRQRGSKGTRSKLFFNLVAETGVCGQSHTPAAVPREIQTASISQEAIWAPGPFWTVAEIFFHTGIPSPGQSTP